MYAHGLTFFGPLNIPEGDERKHVYPSSCVLLLLLLSLLRFWTEATDHSLNFLVLLPVTSLFSRQTNTPTQ